MYFFLKKSNRLLSSLLLLSLFLSLALPLALPRPAHATVPIGGTCDIVDSHCKRFTSKEIALDADWKDLLGLLMGGSFSYDAIMTMLSKAVIKFLRDQVITYIKTGRFSMPTFVQSFTLDPQKMAENAAAIFLSDLTGINFCKGVGGMGGWGGITPNLSFALNLDFNLKCAMSDPDDSDRILNQMIQAPETVDPIDYVLWLDQTNDYVATSYIAEGKKLEYEARALIARERETAAGDGFLGIRDDAGKIKTPGQVVAEPLYDMVANDWSNLETAREISDMVGAVTDVVFKTMFEKIMSGGL